KVNGTSYHPKRHRTHVGATLVALAALAALVRKTTAEAMTTNRG
ncbi:MAG: hypothetical protein ACI9EW_004227, partial [Cellvibrionaceae bacterium]